MRLEEADVLSMLQTMFAWLRRNRMFIANSDLFARSAMRAITNVSLLQSEAIKQSFGL